MSTELRPRVGSSGGRKSWPWAIGAASVRPWS